MYGAPARLGALAALSLPMPVSRQLSEHLVPILVRRIRQRAPLALIDR